MWLSLENDQLKIKNLKELPIFFYVWKNTQINKEKPEDVNMRPGWTWNLLELHRTRGPFLRSPSMSGETRYLV
jgi:hypothetical protein